MTPYSETMNAIVEAAFWAGKDRRIVDVDTDGVSGDLVTAGSFGRRMEGHCAFSICLFACLLVCLCACVLIVFLKCFWCRV